MNNGDTQNFELDQLNLDTTSEDWGHNTPERDQRALGNTAITNPETTHDATVNANPNIEHSTPEAPQQSTSKLGQITPVMPPGYETPTPESALQSKPQNFSFQSSHAMSGDHLSHQAIDVLQDREKELAANGDIASFVDFINTARDEFQGKESKE